jgi:hypothetical protein
MTDRQVFADETSRRARWVILVELCFGLAAVAMAAFVAYALLSSALVAG